MIIHEAWKRSGGPETIRLGRLRAEIDVFYGEAVAEEIWREARTISATTQRGMLETVEALVGLLDREKVDWVEWLSGVRPAILPEGYRAPGGVGWSSRFDLVHRLALGRD